MTLKDLHKGHLDYLSSTTSQSLEICQVSGLVLDAGSPARYFEDDNDMPFRSCHHFAHWCPVEGPNHVVVYEPGRKPKLMFWQPEDFWEEHTSLGNPFWADGYEIQTYAKVDDIWTELAKLKGYAYLGNNESKAQKAGLKVDVPRLKRRMNWARSLKTDYEIECTRLATKTAALAHEAAKNAFFEGASEFEILLKYLEAGQCSVNDLPYFPIIALDEKSAILHYHKFRHTKPGRVFLIDCGYKVHHYPCDITRTYWQGDVTQEFKDLGEGLGAVQQELCRMIRPGVPYEDLHEKTHREVFRLLSEVGVLRQCSEQEALDKEITRAFFPHGLGHMLGIFVHDVASQQTDPDCETPYKGKRYPKLRMARPLDERNLVTVEPGIYFIDMLLRPHREGKTQGYFNWSLIDDLMPLGGIRIEDDVFVTSNGHQNLTRAYLPT